MRWALESGLHYYAVYRSVGEYSDRSEATLLIYDNEAAANYHVQQATAIVNELRAKHPNVFASSSTKDNLYGKKIVGVWDPEFEFHFDWPSYSVGVVPKACLMMDELMKLEAEGG